MSGIKVAVMNTSREITEMLTSVLEEEGFKTCSTYTYLFKDHSQEFSSYVKENLPEVILYDIAPPYKENYILFKKISKLPIAQSIPFVLTTTNKEALESFVGPTSTHELIGKPYDLQEIVNAIKQAYQKKSIKFDSF